MLDRNRLKALFVTNLPAPYRFPVWNRLSKTIDLKVIFLLGENNWRNWKRPKNVNWTFEFLSLPVLRFKEYEFIPFSRGTKRLLKNVDVLIIGSWEVPIYVKLALLAKKRNIPLCIVYESHSESQRFKKGIINSFRSWLFRRANLVITFGGKATDAVREMRVREENICSLFNPVDVEWFHRMSSVRERDMRRGHRFLYVGQLIERKNVDGLIRAFSSIRTDSDSLTIVGEGKKLEQLKNLSRQLGCSSAINFIGQKEPDALAEIYAQSNTLILPSINEVWGLVVNEALASGLHVVVSRNAGVSTLVANMKGCYLCNPEIHSISESMKASKREWKNHILNPEILKYTPERFSDILLERIQSLR